MYCTVDQVKLQTKELVEESASDEFTDLKIAEFSDLSSVPIIDGMLRGRGAPFTTAPVLIQLVDAMLTAAAMMLYIYRRKGDKRSAGERLQDDGMTLLKKIQSGELDPGGEVTAASPIFSGSDETLPAGSIFVGRSGVDWRDKPEERGLV